MASGGGARLRGFRRALFASSELLQIYDRPRKKTSYHYCKLELIFCNSLKYQDNNAFDLDILFGNLFVDITIPVICAVICNPVLFVSTVRLSWSSGKTLAANAGGRGFESH